MIEIYDEMNIKSLRLFIYVIEEGTLGKAAERLNLSQPAASRLLRLLEEELGISLFLRVKKRLVPTQEGNSFYPEAIRIVASIDSVPSFIKQIRKDNYGPLRIVSLPRLESSLILPAITQLLQTWPNIRFNLESYFRRDIERRFTDDFYDVGVGTLPVPMQNVETEYLCSSKFFVVLPKNHPLADKATLTAKDLTDLPYIALNRHTLLRRIIDDNVDSSGINLAPYHEVSTMTAAYDMGRANLGFTIVAQLANENKNIDSIRLVPWDSAASIDYGIFRRITDQPHYAVEDFITCLRTANRRISAD